MVRFIQFDLKGFFNWDSKYQVPDGVRMRWPSSRKSIVKSLMGCTEVVALTKFLTEK